MKKPLHVIAAALLLSAAGCTGSSGSADEAEATLRQAEMALARGDMRAATSAATHLMGDSNYTSLTPRQLGRLSMVYMQMADSADSTTQADHIAAAATLYRKAFALQPDSAAHFYAGVSAGQTGSARMLAAIAEADSTNAILSHEMPDSANINH